MAEPSAPDPAGDRTARGLRSWGPLGILSFLVIIGLGPVFEPLGAVLVIAWAARSRTPWRDLGFVRPRSWTATAVGGVAFGIALKVFLKSIVMPLLGASPINVAYHYLAGNTAAMPEMVLDVIVGAGFNEELVYRGFVFERLGRLLGSTGAALAATVVLGATLFGTVHYPVQGVAGVEQAVVVGLVFGTIFAAKRRIWPLMIAHAAFDLAALAMIYWNVEPWFAHLVFK